MASVSDVLFLQLGLDPASAQEGARQATRIIEDAKRDIQQQGGLLEKIAKDLSSTIETALKNVAGVFGFILTFEGFKNMVIQVSEAGNALGIFAESIDSTVERVGELEQAFQRMGGDEGEIRHVLQKMKSDIQSVRTGGPVPDWFVTLGQAPFSMGNLQNRDPEEILLTASQKAQESHQPPSLLGGWMRGLGLSDAGVTLLARPGGIQESLEHVRSTGTAPTTKQSEAASRIRTSFLDADNAAQAAMRDLIVLTEPFIVGIEKFVKMLAGWMDEMIKWLGGNPIAVALGGGEGASILCPSAPVGSTSTGSPRSTGSTGSTGSIGSIGSSSKPDNTAAKLGRSRPSPESVLRTDAPPAENRSAIPPAIPSGAVTAVGGGPPTAFIMHHTGGRGDTAGVQATLRQRGLGVEYVMDREGNITQIGGPGSSHMMTGWGPKGAGLSNRNTVGMEVIAKDDKDVTAAQVAAAQKFISEKYPSTPVYGHGEVNPGHKEADEGMSIVNAIRRQRGNVVTEKGPVGSNVKGSMFDDVRTASGRSAATTPGIAIPSGGKMGDWYEVTTPDGRKFKTQLIDRGPAAWTGRGVDVSRPLAEQMGYKKDFPTDQQFGLRPLGPQIKLPDVDTGAAAKVKADSSKTEIDNTKSETHINQIHVNTDSHDAAGIAKDIKTEIGKQLSE